MLKVIKYIEYFQLKLLLFLCNNMELQWVSAQATLNATSKVVYEIKYVTLILDFCCQ